MLFCVLEHLHLYRKILIIEIGAIVRSVLFITIIPQYFCEFLIFIFLFGVG